MVRIVSRMRISVMGYLVWDVLLIVPAMRRCPRVGVIAIRIVFHGSSKNLGSWRFA